MFYLRKQYVYRQDSDGGGDAGGGEEEVTNKAPEVEEKARKMGWTPKEEFKGDPEKWRDAAEFVERGENMLPLLRAETKKQERKIAELEKSIKEAVEYYSKTEQRAYEKAFKELKTKQVKAVADGDANAFVEIDKEMAELHKEASSKPKIGASNVHPEYAEWVERNPWAENDPALAKEAEAQAVYLRERGSKLEGAKFLDAVAERVKKEFPDKFSNPRRERAASVEGGTAIPKKGGKTYADLPAEAKAACDRMVKNYGVKKEEYLKNYDWEA